MITLLFFIFAGDCIMPGYFEKGNLSGLDRSLFLQRLFERLFEGAKKLADIGLEEERRSNEREMNMGQFLSFSH